MHYALLAWGTQCHKIELLQKKALRVIFSKSPIAHTEPLLKIMSQPKFSDLYIINLLKLYYTGFVRGITKSYKVLYFIGGLIFC